MKTIIALDFDGVICDSIDECLVTAWNAYLSMNGKLANNSTPDQLPRDFVDTFYKLRYLVRPSGEYGILIDAIQQGITELSEVAFQQMCNGRIDFMSAYERQFYVERNRYRDTDWDGWIKLHRRYDESLAGWQELSQQVSLYIVTKKDLESIRRFNREWSLGLIEDRIYARDCELSKSDAILEIIRLNNTTPDRVYFIDDHPGHLREVAPTGVNCRWASWGYHRIVGCTDFPGIDSLRDIVNEITTQFGSQE